VVGFVPYTLSNDRIEYGREHVNLEVDLLARYLLSAGTAGNLAGGRRLEARSGRMKGSKRFSSIREALQAIRADGECRGTRDRSRKRARNR